MSFSHTLLAITQATAAVFSPLPTDHVDIAPTGDEIIWSLEPADGDVSFRFEVEPGDTVEDTVTLENFTNREITYNLNAADGVVTESGVFDVLGPGQESEGPGTWIELDKNAVTVPAEGSVDVDFSLTVPEGITPGDHPAGITASVSSDGDEAVNLNSRVGVRIHLRVAGDIEPGFTVERLESQHHYNWNPFAPGSATTTWELHNTGNIRLGASQVAEVTGIFGWGTSSVDAEEIREVLPGQSVQLTVDHPEVWPLFVAQSAVDVSPLIVGEDQVEEGLIESTRAEATNVVIPWPQLVLLLVLAGIVVGIVYARKARAKKFEAAVKAAAQKQASAQNAEEKTDA